MKWLIIAGFLVYLVRRGDGGVLKCSSGGDKNASCTHEESIDTLTHVVTVEKEISNGEEIECLAGSEWESNCHQCRCSSTGQAECIKQSNCDTDITLEPIRCKPNTTFSRECNTCICLENGLGLCTLAYCLKRHGAEFSTHQNGDNKQHTTNLPKLQKEDLNQIRLKEKIVDSHNLTRRLRCKANITFKSECNTCKCTSDGRSFSCTNNECVESTDTQVEVFMESEGEDHIERHSVCKSRATFHIGCNACYCNTDGTNYSCTNNPCPLPDDVEIFLELKVHLNKAINNTKHVVCVANRMFIKECNTCWCNEDGTSFFCTRKICVDDTPDNFTGILKANLTHNTNNTAKHVVCLANRMFVKDCNTCWCNEDGTSFSCTRKICVSDDTPDDYTGLSKNQSLPRKTRATQNQEPAKQCQPGTEFRLDCNQCLCDNEGSDFSCTRIDCRALNNQNNGGTVRTKRDVVQNVSVECSPGSVFEQGCNVCRCTQDGHHATCSLRRCPAANTTDTPATDEDPSFRCNPGEQFKQECNDCTCSADGKSIFCTLLFCDSEVLPQ